MSAMEGVNAATAATTHGTTNGTPSASTTLAPNTATDMENQHIQISHISGDLPNPSHCEIRGIITLLWPYSSLTKSLALNLAEKDIRLRTRKGQVKISFTGPLGKHVGAQGLNIDDELVLSLKGAEIVKSQPRDSRDVGYELRYTKKLVGRITSRPSGDVVLEHEAEDEVVPAPVVPFQMVEIPSPVKTPARSRVGAIQNEDGEWASPAFIKRARLSYGSLMTEDFDAFVGDGTIPGKGRKKARFEPRRSGTWRYQSESRSPSPELDVEKQDTTMVEAELQKPKAVMTEQGCQTDDLDYNDSEVQEFLRRSQAIGREVRQDQPQHFKEFEFDQAEMFSPITFPAPSTTPFGKPPDPLFDQRLQNKTPFGEPQVQSSSTPFGEPIAMMSTTPSEPLPEQYQPLASPLASRSTAPVHEEGQWPASLFETMGYKQNSFSKSTTSSTFAQSTNFESFSPVKPASFRQEESEDKNHKSAAHALEELSKIHHAQQLEDAMVDYENPSNQLLQGSLNDLAPALSPLRQPEYPDIPEHEFLTPAKPTYGSRHHSPQYQSKSRQNGIPSPAQRYSRERSETPQNRQPSPMPTSSPFQRAGSQSARAQSETIDLTGESEDQDESQEDEYSEDEEEEQVQPGESFEETRARLLNEPDSEDDGDMEDEENMTEVRIPSFRGLSQKPLMIPKSIEYVGEDDNVSDGSESGSEVHESGSSQDGPAEDYEDDGDEEKISKPDFSNREVPLNPPKPRVLGDRTTEGMYAVEDELEEDAEGDHDSDERPPSFKEKFSDDDGDAENYGEEYDDDDDDIQSDLDPGPIDPDDAIMSEEETGQSWDEEDEEEREEEDLLYDGEQWEGQRAMDIGPAYGHSVSNSRPQSQAPPEIICLSSDDDEPASPKKAAHSLSPTTSTQAHLCASQPGDSSSEDQDMEDESDSSDKQLNAQSDAQLLEAECGHENATEIAELEREVYDRDHDDSSRRSFQSQEDLMSLAPRDVRNAEAVTEGSGYEDEDATAEDIQSPREMVGMDGTWESKPVKTTPQKHLFQPLTQSSAIKAQEELPLPEKIESVEPLAQKEGEDADIEDAEFEVPKDNFDEAEKIKPVDAALLAERDEDRPAQANPGRPHKCPNVEAMSEHVPQTATSSPIKGKDSDDAVKHLATAALMAERDEDRPVRAIETSNVTSTPTRPSTAKQARPLQSASGSPSAKAQLATASLMVAHDEDDPTQRPQNTTNTTTKENAEAALLACEAKLDQEMEEELRVSKDQELTQEAEHDIEMAEVITSPTKTEEREEIEQEIAEDVRMAELSEQQRDATVAGTVEPGLRADQEDVEMDGHIRPTKGRLGATSPSPIQEHDTPIKVTVEPGPRGDPEVVEMDGDIRPADGGLDNVSPISSQQEETVTQESRSDAIVPVVSDARLGGSDVEDQDGDEDDCEDPSSQLFEEMSYIEQSEQVDSQVVEESQESVRQFFVNQATQDTVVATQQSQMALLFSQEVAESAATSFQTLPASPQGGAGQKKDKNVDSPVRKQPARSIEVEGATNDAPAPAADESMPVDIDEHHRNRTRPHDEQSNSNPAKTRDVHEATAMEIDEEPTFHTTPYNKHQASPKIEMAGNPAAHTRSHDTIGERVGDDGVARAEVEPSPEQVDSQNVEMKSIEEVRHPMSHNRSHDKRVGKLRENDRSGSPAEHTRSHDALAGHCVEDDESAKGIQGSTRRKSSSRKSTEQPEEHATPSKAAPVPSDEVLVSLSAVDNVQGTPPKRITRSRRGTQDFIQANSPPKTRKRALSSVIEVPASYHQEESAEATETKRSPKQPVRKSRSRRGTQESVKPVPVSPPKIRQRALGPVVEVPISSIEEAEAPPAELEPAQKPPKRATRAGSSSTQPLNDSPPKTRRTRQKSATPMTEFPASHIPENIQEPEPAPSPSRRASHGRKASIQSAPRAASPPRTRRMSQISQFSPETTAMSEASSSLVLKTIDEEDDELPDPGAAAILEYDDLLQKSKQKPNVSRTSAPTWNLRGKRNESVELESGGQAIPETPIKTRARALRSKAQASNQLAEAHSVPPADPQTPKNKAMASSTGSPLVPPSQWATLTPQAVAAQITKTLRTNLPAYTPLKNIKNYLKKKVDVLAVCVATPAAATKGNKTPHDYILKFFVTEPGSSGTVKEVTAFHHFKKCLPVMCAGNVILLRNFLVDGQNNGCLRSERDSSWAVWRKDGQDPETNSDVPLEFEGGEDEYAIQLKLWWEEKVEQGQKEKLKAAADKGIVRK